MRVLSILHSCSVSVRMRYGDAFSKEIDIPGLIEPLIMKRLLLAARRVGGKTIDIMK